MYDTTGTNTDGAMTQRATTAMVFADPGTKYNVAIGNESGYTVGNNAIAVGNGTRVTAERSVALGSFARAQHPYSIALGAGAATSARGEVTIELRTGITNAGYNNSQYRLLTGLYDGQSAHDAATVGQITPLSDTTAPTTATVGTLGKIYIDTTNGNAYMCVDASDPYVWKKLTP